MRRFAEVVDAGPDEIADDVREFGGVLPAYEEIARVGFGGEHDAGGDALVVGFVAVDLIVVAHNVKP